MDHKARVQSRVSSLPDSVFDCERCDTDNAMQIRRSSLNEQFYADDVGLKCSNCRYYATHGIPFETAETFKRERAARNNRVVDFTEEENEQVKERLEALGYLGKAGDL